MPVVHRRLPTRSRWLGTFAPVVLATVVLATCSDGEVVEAGADDVISHPQGEELVLQVRRVGGLHPGRVFADVPFATVLGNGTRGNESGVTERQGRLREEVLSFVSALAAPDQELVPPEEVGETRPFEAHRFAIRARPVQSGEEEPPDGIEPEVLEWPVPEVDLDGAADCQVVEGEQVERLAEVLAGAKTLTRFRQDGVVYDLAVRPLIPPEEGCADVTAG